MKVGIQNKKIYYCGDEFNCNELKCVRERIRRFPSYIVAFPLMFTEVVILLYVNLWSWRHK